MSREGQTLVYSGEEALAVRMWQQERDEFYASWTALSDRFRDDPEVCAHLQKMDVALGDVTTEYTHVLHARLVRVLPHLADVLTYLLWPEFIPFPDWVEQRGTPLPWLNSGQKRNIVDDGT